jgi:alanine dehydrogenase
MQYKTIGLAKEEISPENPNDDETRVAMLPQEIEQLALHDLSVRILVQKGAGERLGISDEEYRQVGAEIVSGDELYHQSDLVIKFKGPPNSRIMQMHPGASLFCMLHLEEFPRRRDLLYRHKINTISMERIRDIPEKISYNYALAQMAIQHAIHSSGIPEPLQDIIVVGYSDRLDGALRYAGSRKCTANSIQIISPDELSKSIESGKAISSNALVFFDSHMAEPPKGLEKLKKMGVNTFDLSDYESQNAEKALEAYIQQNIPKKTGRRIIQALALTGEGGANLAFEKWQQLSGKSLKDAHLVVLGGGNIALGAVEYALKKGVPRIDLLNRHLTEPNRITTALSRADIIINGANQDADQIGKRFLVTNQHIEQGIIRPGTVISDLVSGSENCRSPIEPIESHTTPSKPFITTPQGVWVASVWGWPVLAEDGAIRSVRIYSEQICNILLGAARLIDGVDGKMADEVQRAVVKCAGQVQENQHTQVAGYSL